MIFKTKLFYVYLIILLYVINYISITCNGKRLAFNLERPKILFYNTSYVKSLYVTTRKYNRTNSLHFLTFRCETLRPFDDDYTMSYYVYQLLSNAYKRTFVEYHSTACHLLSPDNIFFEIVKESYYRNPVSQRPMKTLKCPAKPGYYVFNDMKLRLISVPENFPFRQGRLHFNVTHKKENLVGTGYVDIELKKIE